MHSIRLLRLASLVLALATVVSLGGTAVAQTGCGVAMGDFQTALKANTPEALASYLNKHAPCFEAPAQARLDALGGAPEEPVVVPAAIDVEAGPIWNNDHASQVCPAVCGAEQQRQWTGHWMTTIPNEMSVCNCQ